MTAEQTLGTTEYERFLQSIKTRIGEAQVRAGLAVNKELVLLYWDIGQDIIVRQRDSGWGAKVIERISKDLRSEFPSITGFSVRNLKYMRSLAEHYPDRTFVQQLVAQIPWGHNVRILDKTKTHKEREFYIRQTIANGWSRNVLALQIDSGLYARQGKAITNFELTLPKSQSDLAREILKDPYKFDFLMLDSEAQERDVENALISHLRKFLLELGVGFAFIGNQYHLEVGDQDYYLDLLFYHLKLRCFVVIDLKMREFQPEDSGKMNFYLSAVDDLLRHKNDEPSIGLILCREKNRFIAEYAIRSINKPIGVSEFQLTHVLPRGMEDSLPTAEEVEHTASDQILNRINGTSIAPEELFEAFERRQTRADLSPGVEASISVLLDQFGKGNYEKISAVLFRVWALISLIEKKQLPPTWIEPIDNGSLNVFEPVIVAAATEPLIANNQELEFDVPSFINRVNEIAAFETYQD